MRALVQVVVLAVLVTGSVMLYRRGQPAPAALDAYHKVALRMSRDQVQAVLGRPGSNGPVVIRNAACTGTSEVPAQAGPDFFHGVLVSRAESAMASNASRPIADIVYEGSRGSVIIHDGMATMAEEPHVSGIWQGVESGKLTIISEGIFRQERTLEGVSANSSAKGIRNVSLGTLFWWPGPENRAIVVQLVNDEVCFKSYLGPTAEAR